MSVFRERRGVSLPSPAVAAPCVGSLAYLTPASVMGVAGSRGFSWAIRITPECVVSHAYTVSLTIARVKVGFTESVTCTRVVVYMVFFTATAAIAVEKIP